MGMYCLWVVRVGNIFTGCRRLEVPQAGTFRSSHPLIDLGDIIMTDHLGKSPLDVHDTQAQAVSTDLISDIFRAAVLRWGVLLSTGYLLLWGVAALITRFATGVDSARWWFGGIGLVIVWLVACGLAWHERPDPQQARAVVDGRRKLGGLLMAQDMDGFDVWAQRLSVPTPLRVRWRGGQTLAALGLSAVFLIGAVLAPIPESEASAIAMNVQRTIDSLEDQVQVLEEEQIIDEPQADAMRDDMAKVADDALGTDPSRTWEALDHMGDQLDRTAAEAADEALRKMDDAAAAKSLAQAMQQEDGRLTPQQLSSAMQALSEMTQQAIGEDMAANMSPEMAKALSEAAAAGLDAETLEKLAKMMEGQQADLKKMLAALKDANLIEGKLSDINYELDPAELLEWLESQGECDSDKVCKACKSALAGRGGITRGPAHTEMLWKDPSSKEEASFEPQVLPPSRMRDIEDARLMGVTRAVPDSEPAGGQSTGGALSGVTSTGGSAETAPVLPRHRGAVQRYFQRSVFDNDKDPNSSTAPSGLPESSGESQDAAH